MLCGARYVQPKYPDTPGPTSEITSGALVDLFGVRKQPQTCDNARCTYIAIYI